VSYVVAQLLGALRYKSVGRGFDGIIGIFHCLIPPGRSMTLSSIQPLTEMSTRDISQETKVAGA
jgi:hypothetical protein